MRFMVISILEEDRGKLKRYSSGVSLNHRARDTKAEGNMLPFLLVLKPLRSQEFKIYRAREKMQNFSCLCSLAIRTLLEGCHYGHSGSCCMWLFIANVIDKIIELGNWREGVHAGRCQGILAGLRILLLDLQCLNSQKVLQVLNLVLCLCPKGVRCACLLGILSLIGRNESGKRLSKVKAGVVYQYFAA